MKAYLFSAWFNQWHQGQIVDSCSSGIFHGANLDEARQEAEKALLASGDPEHPGTVKIEKIVIAPVHNQILTETGEVPLDWKQFSEEMTRILESAQLDDNEQGYWVDCNRCPAPTQLSPNIESLQLDLPEDIRSGLNWSLDKTYFFLVSVLSPLPQQQFFEEPLDEPEQRDLQSMDEDEDLEDAGASHHCPCPDVVDKELAVLVRARNSVVAAWLWRKHAAGTPLAGNAIRVTPPP